MRWVIAEKRNILRSLARMLETLLSFFSLLEMKNKRRTKNKKFHYIRFRCDVKDFVNSNADIHIYNHVHLNLSFLDVILSQQ